MLPISVWLQGRACHGGIIVVDDVVGVRNEDTAAYDAKMTPGNSVANVVYANFNASRRHGYGKLIKYAVGEWHEKGVLIKCGDRLYDTHGDAYYAAIDRHNADVVRVQLNSHIG